MLAYLASFCLEVLKFLCLQVVEVPNVSWEDIGGLENVKRELQEVNMLAYFIYAIYIYAASGLRYTAYLCT